MSQLIITEEWRSIDGYINYHVSNIGRVRNSDTGRILKPRIRGKNHDYQAVALYKDGKQNNCSIHRLVAIEFIPNLENKPQVDHIDMDKFNNSVNNLRWVNNSENGMNHKKNTNIITTSQYKGVSYHKPSGKWITSIGFNNSRKHIGLYATEIEAAKAYDVKARELHNEFACLNFPDV